MRYCPPCRRYVSGAAFSCAGCGVAAAKLPYVGPDEPPQGAQTRVELAAPVIPARVVPLHAAPQARRGRARLAPALLVAGLGFAGLCGVAGSSAPGTADAQGSRPFVTPPSLGEPPLGGAGHVPWRGGPGATGEPVTGPAPDVTPSGRQPGVVGATEGVAAVAPAPGSSAPGSSATGYSSSFASLLPEMAPPTAAGNPVSLPSTAPSSASVPSTSTPPPRSGPPSVAPSPSCTLELLGLCL